jgi:hypothetical protein
MCCQYLLSSIPVITSALEDKAIQIWPLLQNSYNYQSNMSSVNLLISYPRIKSECSDALPFGGRVVPKQKRGAFAMDSITEDALCEFGTVDGACILPPPPLPPAARRSRPPWPFVVGKHGRKQIASDFSVGEIATAVAEDRCGKSAGPPQRRRWGLDVEGRWLHTLCERTNRSNRFLCN